MKIISQYQLNDTQIEQVKMSNEDLSKAIRRDMVKQITGDIAERMPVSVERKDDTFQHGYEFAMEMHLYTREQMKHIVDKVKAGTAREIMDALTVDINAIEDVNLFGGHQVPVQSNKTLSSLL